MNDAPSNNQLTTQGEAYGGFAAIIRPQSFDEAERAAKFLAQSDLCPGQFRGKVNDIIIAGAMGARLGLDLISSLNGIAVIGQRACLYGDLMVAVCQRGGEVEMLDESYSGEMFKDDFTAICKVKRKGHAQVYTSTFSVMEAKRAGKWDDRQQVEKRGQNGGTFMAPNTGVWYMWPKRMLMSKARNPALRALFADRLAGFDDADDMADVTSTATVVSTEIGDVAPSAVPAVRRRTARPVAAEATDPNPAAVDPSPAKQDSGTAAAATVATEAPAAGPTVHDPEVLAPEQKAGPVSQDDIIKRCTDLYNHKDKALLPEYRRILKDHAKRWGPAHDMGGASDAVRGEWLADLNKTVAAMHAMKGIK